MKILSIDSSALTASAALCEDDKLLCEYTLNNGNTHSETLLPMVESVLKSCNCRVDDIGLFACSIGPGSFTGVRIGTATVKGLAFSTGIPCIGVSALEALARNLESFDGILCPVMNARRGQVYNALFDSENGIIKRLTPDRAIPLTELYEELQNYKSEKVYLCGDGTGLAENARCGISAPERLLFSSAYSVAMCALEQYRTGVRTTDTELVPVYHRLTQAERERLEKISGSIESNERKLNND